MPNDSSKPIDNSKPGRAEPVRRFMAAGAVLAMGLGLAAQPAEAAPFAYVTNSGANTVSVIDIPTNKVVATVPVGFFPSGVAVTPDGKHVYVANFQSSNVSVIDTAANTVVGTPIPVGNGPIAVAISPGRATRLCPELYGRHRFGDRHRHQHGGAHTRGGA